MFWNFPSNVFLILSVSVPEATNEALCQKFRTLTTGQNCSIVCTNKGGYRYAFSSKQCEALHISWGLLHGPSLEQSERLGLFFIMPVNSLVVDSTFEQREDVAIARLWVWTVAVDLHWWMCPMQFQNSCSFHLRMCIVPMGNLDMQLGRWLGRAEASPTLIITTKKTLYLCIYLCMYVAICRPRVHHACARALDALQLLR
jgi:hypothetical protein